MPESVKKLVALNAAVQVEASRGSAARTDEDYREAATEVFGSKALLAADDGVFNGRRLKMLAAKKGAPRTR